MIGAVIYYGKNTLVAELPIESIPPLTKKGHKSELKSMPKTRQAHT